MEIRISHPQQSRCPIHLYQNSISFLQEASNHSLYVYPLNSVLSAGGTTACVAAGRLAACDPSLKILILEAGPHTLNKAAHVQPYLYPSNILPTSTAFTFNIGNPSPSLNGRAPVVSCGHCVGGGSSVNCS